MVEDPAELAVVVAGLSVDFELLVVRRHPDGGIEAQAADAPCSVGIVEPAPDRLAPTTQYAQRGAKYPPVVVAFHEGAETIRQRGLHDFGDRRDRGSSTLQRSAVPLIVAGHRLAETGRIETHQSGDEVELGLFSPCLPQYLGLHQLLDPLSHPVNCTGACCKG